MMLIDPYRWGVSGPASVELVGATNSMEPVGNITAFSPVEVGPDSPARHIIVALHWRYGEWAIPKAPTSVTINGVDAALCIMADQGQRSASLAFRCAIYSVLLPGGSSASLTVNWDGNIQIAQGWIFRGDNVSSGTPIDAAKQKVVTDGTHVAVNIATDAGGILVACGGTELPATWTGATEDYADGLWSTGASDETPVGEIRNVSYEAPFSPGLNFAYVLAAASFR